MYTVGTILGAILIFFEVVKINTWQFDNHVENVQAWHQSETYFSGGPHASVNMADSIHGRSEGRWWKTQ